MGKPKLLAVASGGGHWVQLQRLSPAFVDFDTVYVSMFESYSTQLNGARLHVIPDASRFDIKPFIPVVWKALKIIMKERPDAVITTGAAPPLAFILLGRIFGARTLWIDSLANSERMSASGRIARKIAHKTVSQWPDVAAAEGVECWGGVL